MPDREQRVTPLELFFDLVFVFAITQVTVLMSEALCWALILWDVRHYREHRVVVR